MGRAEGSAMSTARDDILTGIRRSLKRGPLVGEAAAAIAAKLAAPAPNLLPARARGLDRRGLADLFQKQAEEVACTVVRLGSLDEVPAAVADYLAQHNQPAELIAAPDPLLDRVDWAARPLLRVTRGTPTGQEMVGLGVAFGGVAETGTLMMASGPTAPATLNFLPDTHMVVIPASRLTGTLEEAWARLRAQRGASFPRTVNLITGPSRTGDIEQRIQMGAHGPRRLHILVVEDGSSDSLSPHTSGGRGPG